MSQSKLSVKMPSRTESIIAHREIRKASMVTTTPCPKIKTPGKPFQLNDISYSERLSEAKARSSSGDVIMLQGISHCQALGKDPRTYFMKRIFVLTIIDEPYIEDELNFGDFTAPRNLLVETPVKEVCTLVIGGLPNDESVKEIFAVGTKIHLFETSFVWEQVKGKDNMYNVRFVVDARFGDVYPMGKVIDACRYCLKENAEKKCSACKVPYCSPECQAADWKIMKHKLVCKQKAKVEASEKRSSSSNSTKSSETGHEHPKETEGHICTVFQCPICDFDTSTSHLETGDGPQKAEKTPETRAKAQPAARGPEKPKELISLFSAFRKRYNFMFKQITGDRALSTAPPDCLPIPEIGVPLNPERIVFDEMQYNGFYPTRAIELTIIDDMLPGYHDYAHFLVEDKNRFGACLAVNGLRQPGDSTIGEKYAVGTTILVVHPLWKTGAADGIPILRVEHLSAIKILGRKKDICRLCRKENAKWKCKSCGRLYCNATCEMMDRDICDHAFICETGSTPLIMRFYPLGSTLLESGKVVKSYKPSKS